MTFFDLRLNRMAQLLVRYSLNVQPGNLVVIQAVSYTHLTLPTICSV